MSLQHVESVPLRCVISPTPHRWHAAAHGRPFSIDACLPEASRKRNCHCSGTASAGWCHERVGMGSLPPRELRASPLQVAVYYYSLLRLLDHLPSCADKRTIDDASLSGTDRSTPHRRSIDHPPTGTRSSSRTARSSGGALDQSAAAATTLLQGRPRVRVSAEMMADDVVGHS